MKTPLIKIIYEYNGRQRYIFTKLEYYNITGSIKDRVADYIIKKAKDRGKLKDKMPIFEATSGNTGIALAALGAYYGNPVYIFMPDWASIERIKIMRMYNANVILVSKEEGGFLECVKRAKELAEKENGFLVDQFNNLDNPQAHYETTGQEIIEQLNEEVGGFISGIGTGGTLMGVARKLKEKFPNIRIVALEPDKMPLLSKKAIISSHLIEGIGDDFIPGIVKQNEIDNIVLINDYDAVNMSRILARDLGLGVGISSGANLIGAILLEDTIEKSVVTVFPDDNKKYLSTKLSENVESDQSFISNQIRLVSYEICL